MSFEEGGGRVSDEHRQRRPPPFELSSRHNDDDDHRIFPTSKINIIKRALYFFAFASACFVLCSTFPPKQYNISLSNNPLIRTTLSQNTTLISTSQSSSPTTDDDHNSLIPATSVLVSNNSSGLPPMINNNAPPKDNYSLLLPNSSAVSNVNSSVLVPAAPQNMSTSPVNQKNEEEANKLEKILSAAAMENKTVIVTTVNAAWAAPNSLFDLLLESFRIGIETQRFLKHLVVIALDQKAYARCLELHPHCFALTTPGVDFSTGQVFYMTPNYLKLVWRKIEFMHTVLKLGYSAIFTDADILWFRDPFPHFLADADLQTSCDHYKGTPTRGSSNTGFYYVKSNIKTVQFFEFWLASREKIPNEHDQNVFNKIRSDPFINQTGIEIKLLDTAYYGGFCEPSQDLNLVRTMHSNCCFGLNHKVHDLKMLIEVWKQYLTLPIDERAKQPQAWTISPRMCG